MRSLGHLMTPNATKGSKFAPRHPPSCSASTQLDQPPATSTAGAEAKTPCARQTQVATATARPARPLPFASTRMPPQSTLEIASVEQTTALPPQDLLAMTEHVKKLMPAAMTVARLSTPIHACAELLPTCALPPPPGCTAMAVPAP